MRLKVAESLVEIPGPRLHIHNVSQEGRNSNQRDKLADSTTALHSTQWASNYVTSPNATLLKDHLTINGANFNNNITVSLQQQQRVRRTSYSASSDLLSESSPDDSIGDYDADAQQSSSSLDVSPQGDEYRCFSHEELSDSDSLSDDGNCTGDLVSGRGIVNPNYPGFQHLAHRLQQHSDTDDADEDAIVDEAENNNLLCNNNNNNNNDEGDDVSEDVEGEVVESKIDSVNHLDSVENFQKAFYDKPKFNIPVEADEEHICVVPVSPILGLENVFNVQIPELVSSGRAPEVAEVNDVTETVAVDGDVGVQESVNVQFRFVEDVEETVSLGTGNIESSFGKERDRGTDDAGNSALHLDCDEVLGVIPRTAEDCVETSLIEGKLHASFTNESFVAETSLVLFPEAQYVETAFVGLGSKESVFSETEEDAIDSLVTEAENIEEALADEKLNETLFADLENIKNAFANDEPYEHRIGKRENIIKFSENAFVDISLDDLSPVKYVDSDIVTSMMAATAIVPMETSPPIPTVKMEDAFLSNAVEDLPAMEEVIKNELLQKAAENTDVYSKENIQHGDSNRATDEREKFIKEAQTSNENEKDEDSVIPRKKEKMEINFSMKKNRHSVGSVKGVAGELSLPLNMGGGGVVRRREFGPRGRDLMMASRRSMPSAREKKRSSPEMLGGFDVYNIETAMPKIDLDAIESHLKAAREEDRRRRNDREEIRKRLAMGSDADEYYGGERPGRKPSLQARLQSGMNLQICFMNETVSDTESPNSDTEVPSSPVKHNNMDKTIATRNTYALPLKSPSTATGPVRTRPSTSMLTLPLRREPDLTPMTEADFFARQARLQTEARMALAQAKEMAHMQMEIERQRQKKSPITEMVRSSLEKVGIPFPEDRRRVSRQILTEMNLAQLQVIVNDLHTQIEVLNESLVKFLMNRDDLHMEQDSMLVDIEDLTRYLGAKEQPTKEPKEPLIPQNNNLLLVTNKPKLNRIAGVVKK